MITQAPKEPEKLGGAPAVAAALPIQALKEPEDKVVFPSGKRRSACLGCDCNPPFPGAGGL